jgi:DNA helicase-2/ATP-dependent DNA helicase PcrA
MSAPGPPELGRGLVLDAGQTVPVAWAGCERLRLTADVVDDPAAAVALLHAAWASRTPVVVELAVDPATFRAPLAYRGEPWTYGPDHELWHDRLHFLVWANTYDGRRGDLMWWWSRKAARLGATVTDGEGDGDVLLADGTAVWIDGGPRGPLSTDLAVVHRESVDAGRLSIVPPPVPPTGHLAPDQLEAVGHGAGPARIIAPAGSGKTRALTERLRTLLGPRGYEPEGVLAVAYNTKAKDEMLSRTADVPARIQTLNAWAYEIVGRWLGRRPRVLDIGEVRAIVERLVPRQPRRRNTDPLAPYIDGLSLIRLGLRRPVDVEAAIDDVTGLADAFLPYRAALRERGVVDFDEQVYLAVEALLSDGAFRQDVQRTHRHLLVDEFQDLTPAHVLLVRLVTCPAFDVFGVGDDDQTIYGHAGADPRFLIDFGRSFPGAAAHALEVNYRCPVAVTAAAATLLSYNDRRVEKRIVSGPAVDPSPDALEVRLHPTGEAAAALVEHVSVAPPADVAVLTRVQSLLLAPHVALAEAGVPFSSILTVDVLNRLGVRAALAYLRIAVAPERIAPGDLVEVHRRPSRGLPNWAEKWLGRCRTIEDIDRAADRIDDPKVGGKLGDLAADLSFLALKAADGATTRVLLTAVRDDIGVGAAMTLLDATGGTGGSHLDDIEALLQVADLHPDAESFEAWLRRALATPPAAGGVTLSTIHRVKGREWDHVIVFGASDGIMPHRLADDIEEERRVLHVAITRGRHRVVVLADAARPSPFLGELDGRAPHGPIARAPRPVAAAAPAAPRPAVVLDDDAAAIAAELRAWRRQRSQADGVPAYVVLSDRHLDAIAAAAPATLAALRACPGIGPAKLEAYGEEILAVIATAPGTPT